MEQHDLVNRISMLGTSGKYTQNCERDFHFLLKSFSKRLGVKIGAVQARLFSHATASIEWQKISVIFPDDMAKALFAKGEKIFRHTMFGDHSLNSAYKGSETGSVTVLGWCSDFAYGNSSLTRYFPIAVFPEYVATEFTYEDIMKPVVDRVRDMIDPQMLHDWSTDGYAFMLSSIQGDLKFIVEQYGLHNYRANACCSLCGAVKKDVNPSMTISDFRENAAHSTTAPDLTGFYAKGSWAFTSSIVWAVFSFSNIRSSTE